MILSHMRYNSPVDRSTERGDRDGEGGSGRLPVCNQSFRKKKKKVKTLGFLFTVANSFQSVKRPFCSA